MKINLDLSSTTLALVLLTSVTMSEAISVKRLTSRELSSSRRDHYSRDVTLPSQTALQNSARSILQTRADSDSEDATDSSGNGSNVDDSNGGEEDEECSDDEGDDDTSGSANQTGQGSDDVEDQEEECEDGEEETTNQDESGGGEGEADDEVCEDEESSGGASTDDESSSNGGEIEDQSSADSGNSDDREDSGSSSDEDSSSTASTSANAAPTSTKHSKSKAKASTTSTSASHGSSSGSGSGSGSSPGVVAAVKDLVGTTRNGQGTFFTPDTGACGWPNTEQDYIVAISHSLYDKYTKNGNPNNNSLCGRQIKATYQGKSVTATIADRCEGCAEWDLDFTPAAFKQLASESVGRMDIKWQFTGK